MWCATKRHYATRQEAINTITTLRHKPPNLRTYWCPVHQCWHLTSAIQTRGVQLRGDPLARDWPLDKETT